MSRRGRWDIFCSVIDNYGDVGVAWRLARQLTQDFAQDVSLWVDDIEALQHLWAEVHPLLESQQVEGVTVRRWRESLPADSDADVVIEAFGCHLPEPCLSVLAARSPRPVWLNLEYLSAENWVEDCHGLPSIHPTLPLTKYFFFPGFTARTGGLLRERGLIEQRRAFQSDPQARFTFLANLGVEVPPETRIYSLFCYETPAIAGWLEALAADTTPTLCLVPEGRALTAVAAWLQVDGLRAGDRQQRGALTVHALPFLRQDSYDRLLWSCDFNVVRGEDSFVRAQWAARPFCWHIYPQVGGAHWLKLDAFLHLYTEGMPAELAAATRAFAMAWSGDGDIAAAWAQLSPLASTAQLAVTQQSIEAWSDAMAARPDLASALLEFCETHRQAGA